MIFGVRKANIWSLVDVAKVLRSPHYNHQTILDGCDANDGFANFETSFTKLCFYVLFFLFFSNTMRMHALASASSRGEKKLRVVVVVVVIGTWLRIGSAKSIIIIIV